MRSLIRKVNPLNRKNNKSKLLYAITLGTTMYLSYTFGAAHTYAQYQSKIGELNSKISKLEEKCISSNYYKMEKKTLEDASAEMRGTIKYYPFCWLYDKFEGRNT